MGKRILLSGYFGYGNIGDEAILEAECAHLRLLRPDLELSVLMDNKARAEELQLIPYKRKSLWHIFQAVKSCDLVISGGGGLFQDSTGFGSVMYYGMILAAASILGKPSFIFSQGFGPIKTGIGKSLAKALLPLASKASFRDAASAEEFKKFAPDVPAEVTADPVFLLPSLSEEEAERALDKCALPDPQKPVLAVIIRNWFGLDVAEYAKALNGWAASFEKGACPQILVLPFQYWFDEGISRRLTSLLEADCVMAPELGVREMMALFSSPRIEMIFSMRLHALIMGAVCGRSVYGVSYDPKVERLCALCGAPCVDFSGLKADRMTECLKKGWTERRERAEEISAGAANLRERAQKAAIMALELL
ncbi:polysaccharide pyruvyl transferase CsaB [bacterium]|nr:polysaccharide pyruvyl transferase CsaB [bacterium]